MDKWFQRFQNKDYFSKLMAAIVLSICFWIFIGWTFDYPFFRSLIPGTASANPLSALLLMAASSAVIFNVSNRWLYSLGATITTIGCLVVFRGLGLDLHLDQILFSDKIGANRMAVSTAVSFVFLGLAVFSIQLKSLKHFRISDIFSLCSLTFGMVTITGYFYGANGLYGPTGYAPMSFATGLCIVMVSLAVFFLDIENSLGEVLTRKDLGGRAARRLIPAMILVPIVLGWLELHGVRYDLLAPQVAAALRSVAMICILTGLASAIAVSLSRSQDATHRHNQILASVLNCMGDGVIVFDLNGQRVLENPAAQKYIPYRDSGQLQHILLPDQRTPADPKQYPSSLALQGMNSDDTEYFLKQADESSGMYVSLSARPLKAPDLTIQGAIVIIRDITERKLLEQSLIDSNALLEKKANEQQQALIGAEAQIQQLQKMDAIGRLAGGMAHDFNNLLAIINMHCETLMEETADKLPMRQSVQEILNVAQKGASLTQQLLLFSRKHVAQSQVAVSINQVTQQLLRMLERLLPSNIELKTQFSDQLPMIKADPSQIEQVIMNLVVNARDAISGNGTIRIETSKINLTKDFVTAHLMAKAGQHVVLTIADSGCGMSPETQSRIFEPFYTTKPVGKGTGLGLATVYGIIKQLGGTVSVQSEVNKGTVINVYLPADEALATLSNTVPISEDAPLTQKRGTILLVEDEEKLRTLFSRILEKKGYKVLTSKNGIEALALEKQLESKPDLLLTDAVMPEMGGFELAQKMREISPNMKVLFMSGYADIDDGPGSIKIDENIPFLQKPFDSKALLNKIQEIVG